MNIAQYVIFFIILIGLSSVYKHLKLDEDKTTSAYYYNMVNKYLFNKDSLGMNTKPSLWVYLHNDNTITPSVNSRHWLSFNSRSTTEFNQPYQSLTLQSIIKNCSNDFNIYLIDDESFEKIIPGWSLDLTKIANPSRTHIRLLALCSILNIYGGILVPSSFICFKSLIDLYNITVIENKMCVGEFLNKTSNVVAPLLPAPIFMGCNANNEVMKEFINYLEILNSTDFTAESDFLGKTNHWLATAINNDKIYSIAGEYLGTKKVCGSPIYVEELVGSSFIELHLDAFGLYIPWNELINRTSLQWFCRLSPQQVLESDTIIGKYLLVNN
jgi:hypothetical protein